MNSKRNKALTAIRVVVWIFMIGAAAISTRHIVHVSQMLGLGWESYTVPAFVDGIAIVGKVSMLSQFSPAFRKSGFRLLMFGGTLSLAANVAAGSNWGERAFGVLVVAGFMALESHATKADRTAVVEPVVEVAAKPAPVKPTEAELKARKNAGYDKKSSDEKKAWTKAYRERMAKRNAATAPVSPGHGPVSAPSEADLDALVR